MLYAIIRLHEMSSLSRVCVEEEEEATEDERRQTLNF